MRVRLVAAPALLPALLAALLVGCASAPASPPSSAPPPAPGPSSSTDTAPDAEHHHELHLPPVGPSVQVSLGDKHADVALAALPHDGPTVPLLQVWKAAFATEDPAALRFNLFGSDGFHPQARSKCPALLTGGQIAAARIDVATHDVSYDDALNLPGCYRVKAVVRIEASR